MTYEKGRVNIGKSLGIAVGDTVTVVIAVKDLTTGLPVDLTTYGTLAMTVYDRDDVDGAKTLIATKSGLASQDVDGTNDGAVYPLLRSDTVAAGVQKVGAGPWFYELRDTTAGRRVAWGDFVLLPSPDVT